MKPIINKTMKKETIIEFFKRLQAINPGTKGRIELHQSVYPARCGCIIGAGHRCRGQQSHARPVCRSRHTGERWSPSAKIVIRHHIKTIGLFNSKAANVYKLSQILIDEYNSEVPQDRDDTLVKLTRCRA